MTKFNAARIPSPFDSYALICGYLSGQAPEAETFPPFPSDGAPMHLFRWGHFLRFCPFFLPFVLLFGQFSFIMKHICPFVQLQTQKLEYIYTL